MQSREDVLKKIRLIDQQMNDIIAKNPATQIAYDPAPFPWGPLTITAIVGAAYQYGSQIHQSLVEFRDWVMYAGALFAFLTVVLFFRWVVGLGRRGDKSYRAANAKLVELRKQKAILEGQLN